MNTSFNKDIFSAYDAAAQAYEDHSADSAHNAYCERPAMLSLFPDVNGRRVLDAGCGSGFYTEWLVGRGALVTSVDGSSEMVALTRRRVEDAADIRVWNLNTPLTFLEDASTDLVICPLVLEYIEDLHRIFQDFYRILKPGGHLIFSLEHPFGVFEKHGKNYHAVEYIQRAFSIGLTIPCYRRSFQAVIDPLIDAGFVMERLLEPVPVEACRDVHPDAYEKLSRRPSFYCIKAVKNHRSPG